MEDLIGIKVKDKILGEVGLITWGRIFRSVDESKLLEVIKNNLSQFGITEPYSVEVCYTLQEVSSFPYFYEALFDFSQRIIPDGKKYKPWQRKMAKALLQGEEIYFLGLTQAQKDAYEKHRRNILTGTSIWYYSRKDEDAFFE